MRKAKQISHGVYIMNVNEIKQFLSFQAKALDCLEFLIKYDREQATKNNQPAERTIVLKAFIDTQRRSLDVANLLLAKHEEAIIKDEKAKAENEQRAKVQAIKSKPLPTITQQPKQKAENEEVGLFDALHGDDNK